MNKNNFKKRLGCSLVAILSLCALFGNTLHAAKLTYSQGVLATASIAGLPDTLTVDEGAVVVIDKKVKTPGFVLLGWNTLQMAVATTSMMEMLVTKTLGKFYAVGDSLPVTGEQTLYAVWARDANNDGHPDYGGVIITPTIRSLYPNGLPPLVFDEDGNDISLRSLPAWNGNFDLSVADSAVYYVGCSYWEDDLITLSEYFVADTSKVYPKKPMYLMIEYGGVLEPNSLVAGWEQKAISKIEITQDMINPGPNTFSIDTLIDKDPFMFTSIKKDGQGILKMWFYDPATDSVAHITDFLFGKTPMLWPTLFKDPETGAFTDTLTLKFDIYNKPTFASEVVRLRMDANGCIDLKHESGTPLKYIMRSIDGQSWRPAEAPLSTREKNAIGGGVSICLREMDRNIGNKQVWINYLTNNINDSIINRNNYYKYRGELEHYYLGVVADSVWTNYFLTDVSYLTPHPWLMMSIKDVYDMIMMTPGFTHQDGIINTIAVFEPFITATDTHFSNIFVEVQSLMTDANMLAYGKRLASLIEVPEPCRNVFCLEFETPSMPVINREVVIPQVDGVTINVGYGVHYVASQGDFTFTAKYASGLPMTIKTGRTIQGVEEVLTGTLNENGEYEYVIPQVTQNITLVFSITVDNASVADETAVWSSHNNTICIRVAKEEVATIYSIAGQLVKRVELSEGQVSVPVERGVYVVTLKDGSIHKVVVK